MDNVLGVVPLEASLLADEINQDNLKTDRTVGLWLGGACAAGESAEGDLVLQITCLMPRALLLPILDRPRVLLASDSKTPEKTARSNLAEGALERMRGMRLRLLVDVDALDLDELNKARERQGIEPLAELASLE